MAVAKLKAEVALKAERESSSASAAAKAAMVAASSPEKTPPPPPPPQQSPPGRQVAAESRLEGRLEEMEDELAKWKREAEKLGCSGRRTGAERKLGEP